MKKLIYILLLLPAAFISSCDYVDNPYPEVNANLGDTADCPVPTFPALAVHVKKILIEDFTGHTCGNCPKAAKELHEIDSLYPGRIIGLAPHVGSFALPAPGYNGSPSTAFLADYSTSVGDEYDAFFGASNFGLPQGMFNRKEFHAVDLTHLKFYPNWKTYAASIIGEPSVADLQIITDYDTTSRKLCCAVKSTFLNAMSGDYKLVVLVTQDSVVDWQDNQGTVQADYVHRHMLRDAITPSGAWGELIASSPAAGAANTKRFAYTIPAGYNSIPFDHHHGHIVAFIYNTATQEVIQSEEAELIH